ncbi:uncharacterized protein N7446_012879 [Penicillium canescens]|uniref:Uncharacterized protein n=1 Tax=Penicillium canescens TaxID=5083 RepID=A0AAD6HY12_PENCN|nr:uncharacterized protein N7446_012879 [Penicillium canescens]KAJ6022529.1 hypothetical protein N7460_012924 [Penicillium canescens]KAJ6026211.1 hypothetical protein N7444_013890 [Penicillium canescens]KAJ6041813.1 hypothetical protein N7446_012879 [Penicillium canescens]
MIANEFKRNVVLDGLISTATMAEIPTYGACGSRGDGARMGFHSTDCLHWYQYPRDGTEY